MSQSASDAVTQLTTFWTTIAQVDCVLALAIVVEGRAIARQVTPRGASPRLFVVRLVDDGLGGLPALLASGCLVALGLCIWHATSYLASPTGTDPRWVSGSQTWTALSIALLVIRPVLEILFGRVMQALRSIPGSVRE